MIQGICDSAFDACQKVSSYHPTAISNWLDYRHCQYHAKDDWNHIVGTVTWRDSYWHYCVYNVEESEEDQNELQ